MSFEQEFELVVNETIKRKLESEIKLMKDEIIEENDKNGLFKKVEALLYNYPRFKKALQEKEETKTEIMQYGVRHGSKGITSVVGSSGYYEFVSDYEKKEDALEKIEKSIQNTKNQIETLETALDQIKNRKYHQILQMKYFDGWTYDRIADHFDISVDTVRSQKNKLIQELVTKLYPETCFAEMMSWLVF